MFKNPLITVITPTYKRHKLLIFCIEQVKNQDISLPYEHIVISDGDDEEVKNICNYYKIKCKCIEKEENTQGSKGHLARDTGIKMASGKFLVLWDDDNIYYKNALTKLTDCIKPNYDIAICDIHFLTYYKNRNKNEEIYNTIPNNWTGTFEKTNIDTMNVMVKTNLAKKEKWTNSKDYAGDFYWLKSLQERNIKINYLKSCIGIKI